MNFIPVFRKLVYAQVLLGMFSFCMAEQNPILAVVAISLALLSWYTVEVPQRTPVPHWIILLGALASVALLFLEVGYIRIEGTPDRMVRSVGHFTIWLQILQIYSDKTNRDYALILSLSLLQMVGASVLSLSVVFGLLLGAYCFLFLFTILLFDFKSSRDSISNPTTPNGRPKTEQDSDRNALTSRLAKQQFISTAIYLGSATAIIASIVFLLCPRTSRFQFAHQLAGMSSNRQIGFAHQVQLGVPIPRLENREPILHLKILYHDSNVGSIGQTWRIRGACLDTYNPTTRTWTRSPELSRLDAPLNILDAGKPLAQIQSDIPLLEAIVTLRNIQDRTLFSLEFPTAYLQSPDISTIRFNTEDQQLASTEALSGISTYTLYAPLNPPPAMFESYRRLGPTFADWETSRQPRTRKRDRFQPQEYAQLWTVQTEKIKKLASSVLQQNGIKINPTDDSGAHQTDAALALTRYLRDHSTYSLSNPRNPSDDDPISEFLFNTPQGHCELFASGLAAMARSIGLRARVVTGYLANDFNSIGGYYIVRQSDAHAWAEIECGKMGWRSFDPTPPQEVGKEHRVERGWFSVLRDLYEHLDYNWISTIVTYDKETRHAILGSFKTSVRKIMGDSNTWLTHQLHHFSKRIRPVQDWASNNKWDAGLSLLSLVLLLILLTIRGPLHKSTTTRPDRNHPNINPRLKHHEPQFYLRMNELLSRHGHNKPLWQTPMSFASGFLTSNPHAHPPILKLTELFYAVRFGSNQLSPNAENDAATHLAELESILSKPHSDQKNQA